MRIILASGSPRRQELLKRMGVKDFEILVPDIDENMGRDMGPDELVKTISAEKARAASALANDPEALIITADTVVALDGQVLGKPKDQADAVRMLTELSGRAHQVYTGFTVLQGERVASRVECTQVSFRPLIREEIDCYVNSGEPMDKAGAYGIQGYGSMLVEGIHGDYFNVVGLPICALGRALADFGLDCLKLAAR